MGPNVCLGALSISTTIFNKKNIGLEEAAATSTTAVKSIWFKIILDRLMHKLGVEPREVGILTDTDSSIRVLQ